MSKGQVCRAGAAGDDMKCWNIIWQKPTNMMLLSQQKVGVENKNSRKNNKPWNKVFSSMTQQKVQIVLSS